LQVKYLSVAGIILAKIRTLDEILNKIGDFGWTKNDILDSIFVQSKFIVYSCGVTHFAVP